MTDADKRLQERVQQAAEAALAHHQYVSPIDILTGTGYLSEADLQNWRRGRVPCLERVVNCNLSRLSRVMKMFSQWARGHGLKPSETRYKHRSFELRFSMSGHPSIEKAYRTHYVSPRIKEIRRENMQHKLRGSKGLVYWTVKDSQCSQCGAELPEGSFALMDAGDPICLPCARIDHLEFLPHGYARLTQRALKHSGAKMKVVSLTPEGDRVEGKGILVEPAAILKAEADFAKGAGPRRLQREQQRAAREASRFELACVLFKQIREAFPACPEDRARFAAEHMAARRQEPGGCDSVKLGLAAAVRDRHTSYPELLQAGMDRAEARARVSAEVEEILRAWAANAD